MTRKVLSRFFFPFPFYFSPILKIETQPTHHPLSPAKKSSDPPFNPTPMVSVGGWVNTTNTTNNTHMNHLPSHNQLHPTTIIMHTTTTTTTTNNKQPQQPTLAGKVDEGVH